VAFVSWWFDWRVCSLTLDATPERGSFFYATGRFMHGHTHARVPHYAGSMRIAFTLALCLAFDGVRAADAPIRFDRDVLPILSDKCFACHGPDTKKKNELRLDTPAAATADRGGYKAVDPDAPEKSELLKRIFDADDPMPPTDFEKALSAREKETLKRWILQGGRYARHWAFVSPTRVAGRDIDFFIERQLQGRGLDFAPEADAHTLARRVALVLTGLPPEPKELEAFLSDSGSGAYGRLVERLLRSPRFGEHQARYWLDAVRYGDTHGLHLDNRRGIYPYRDWVVRAFNENLPLDKFIQWQVAGDLLPDPSVEQLIATGFVRMNPSTGEGGAIAEEFQAKNNMDRVETLGTALLGASLVCARCHTHKYDPYTQTEYYRMMAFFNSTAEPPLDKNVYRYGPHIFVPKDAAAWDQWQRIVKARDELIAGARPHREALEVHAPKTLGWKTSAWKLTGNIARGKRPEPRSFKPAKGLPGKTGERLPKDAQARWVSFKIHAKTNQTLWLRFTSGDGHRVELNGEAINGFGTLTPLRVSPGENEVLLKLSGSPDRYTVEVELFNPWEALAQGAAWDDCPKADGLRMLGDAFGPALGELSERAAALLHEATVAEGHFTTTLIARDLLKPRETRFLRRGEYDQPVGEPLEPGVFEAMLPFPEDAPRNRLGLAQWLTSPEHPLVTRVLANRIWQRVFGEPLVRTPEEFGRQGEFPTHPELLDWLAVELRESGWDQKHLIRLMVNSRTFKQSSVWRKGVDDPENRLFARGPRHRLDAEVIRDIGLWASGLLDPHMGGEGVKPWQPPGMWKALTHPASNTVNYEPDKGRKVYRRSLYVYWKRTSPHPMMTLFDAPSRETSCVRRYRSNTPVQSLGLFNERQRLEMARKLGERLLLERDDDLKRIDRLFRLLACREANAVERRALTRLLDRMRREYQADPEAVRALLAHGEAAVERQLNPVELAAWAQVAATVLASDVAILLY